MPGERVVVGLAMVALVALAGCGGGDAAAQPKAPVLEAPPPPAAGDPAAEGAPYLALVAGRLAPEWRHFLEDCRLRLPSTHALNDLRLEARADLVVDRAGVVVSQDVTSSGNRDFDAAVTEVISAIGPLPSPPTWLLSDDDRLRLSWRFARDQRQASAQGAEVNWLEEPAAQVVERRLAAGDTGGAARRVARLDDTDPQLPELARRVFIAILAEGLTGSGQAQRAAVEAVQRVGITELASQLAPLAAATDPALRGQAVAALAALAEPATAPILLEQLAATRDPMLAATLTRALQAISAASAPGAAGATGAASANPAVPAAPVAAKASLVLTPTAVATEAVFLRLADGDRDAQVTAMAALAELQVTPAVAARVTRWSTSRDPLLRGALCAAVARAKILSSLKWDILGRGLDDRDGSARAACTAALVQLGSKPLPWMRAALRRLVDDRDQRVRAAAVAASMRWEPTRLDDRLRVLVADADPVVRAATVAALSRRADLETLRTMLADPDAGVRRTVALALVLADGPAVREATMRDPDPRVRMVALEVKQDLAITLKAMANDESSEVRTEVEVLHVTNRGETLQSGMVRLASAGPASVERVRIALAWLLAT